MKDRLQSVPGVMRRATRAEKVISLAKMVFEGVERGDIFCGFT